MRNKKAETAASSNRVSLLLLAAVLIGACSSPDKQQLKTALNSSEANEWMDTVRFNSKLTDKQRQQVYLARNNEEDYTKLRDTARIMLRFFWWRAFDPYVVVRLENRPEIYDSSRVRRIYQEWFALYKEDISRLNHDCPVRINERCTGKPYPFVHQQHVELLPVNKTPAILKMLDSIGFWKMKPVYQAGPHTDGSDWMLEVYYKGKYKQVSTDRQQHPLKAVCLRLLQLSGYKPKRVY